MMRSRPLKLLLPLTLLVTTIGCFAQEVTINPNLPSTTPQIAEVTINPDLPSTTPQIAIAAPVKAAKSAFAFVDSICINTHWGYDDTAYGQKYNAVKQKLVDLGVRHVRDGGTKKM